MLIVCPKCAKRNEIPHVERGRHIECVCGSTFILDGKTVVQDYSEVDGPPPEKIGNYPVERFIGRGGMGDVFLGTHPQLHLPVAIKILRKDFAANEAFKERFFISSRICAKLTSQNVVRVYDAGTDADGTPFLVMEYIPGGTLYDILQKEGPLPPKRVAEIGIAVCGALSEAAKFGIVHRDIKPDNIMVDAEGVYKLSDLGLAKMDVNKHAVREESKYMSDTVEFTSMGTPEYMSPEQGFDAKNCDIRSDIYSLGVTLYELATGHLPIECRDPEKMKRLRWEVAPTDPAVHGVDLPAEFTGILMCCLRKESGERYASADALKAELEAFVRGRKEEQSVRTPAWRTRVLLFLFLLIILALCNAIFFFFHILASKQSIRLPDMLKHAAELPNAVPDETQ